MSFFGRSRVPVPTGSEATAFDARAARDAGVPERVLMESAGRAAAQCVQRLHPEGWVAVVVGKGNNGGDGLVLARALTAWGREVEVLEVGERSEPDPLTHGWDLSRRRLEDEDALRRRLSGAGVVVDALLGTGIRGAPRPLQAGAIRSMNDAGSPVVALDIPSGVDADSGAAPGEAIRAAETIAFGAPKLGSLLHPGRERSGRVLAVEIGFPPWSAEDASVLLITPAWASECRPRREAVTHKNAAGRLLLLVGSPGLAGAALLSAGAALRAGVGFLRVATPPALRELVQGRVPEAVWVDASDASTLSEAVEASDAVAAGPGLGTGEEARRLLDVVTNAAAERAILLDADALNLLAQHPESGWKAHLLTPHPGEAGRLLERDSREMAADPVDSARSLARRFGSAVLLKGTPSVVAPSSPEGELLVSASGSSDLARAGMGDVLTGVAGAFLARGASPRSAAGLALHFTGRAAARAAAGEALLPTDLIHHLPAALSEEGAGSSSLDLPFLLLDLPPLP